MLKVIFYNVMRFSFIILLGGVMWFIGLILFTRLIPFAPVNNPHHTNGIVIFTGEGSRLKEALSLFEQKKADYLLISGVNPSCNLPQMIQQRPDKSFITLGYSALDTSGNAVETAVWARSHPIKSLRLITSNYHMPRSLFELNRMLPGVKIVAHPVIGKRFNQKKWWLDGITLGIVIQEYNKFIFSILRRQLEDVKKILYSKNENETLPQISSL